MHEEIFTRVMPLPGKVGGFVVRKDNVCTIVVNENHSEQARMKYYREEMEHINSGDLDSEETADRIEANAHGGRQ